MATISTLAVNLIARTSVFERGMRRSRKSVKGFRTDITSTTSRLASFAKGLLVSGGAVFAIKSLTEAASRAQETMNLFNTVFAENATVTAKWANAFAKDVGRSRTEVKEWAATLQDTFVPLGFARDKAAELSKSLVELAVDVGSFKNIASDKEVIDAFTSAIVGNHRAVRAYGVVLTNATIQQAAMQAGIRKTFAELTELEKVQLRYNLIMKSTLDAQGDAIKTAENYANRLKKLKGQWVDLKEAIGNSVLPAMTRLLGILTKYNKEIAVSVARTVAFVLKVGLSIKVIQLTVRAIMFLVKAYKGLAAIQTITLSLGGPAGWAALAAGALVAAAAIKTINKTIDDTVKGIERMGMTLHELPLQKFTPPDLTKKELMKESMLLQLSIINDQKTIDKWYAKWGETLRIPTNRIEESHKRLIDVENKLRDIYALEKQEKDIINLGALTKEAEALKKAILSPAEKLVALQARYAEMLDNGLLTLKEYEKAMDAQSIFKPLVDMLAEGIISAKEFGDVIDEIGSGGQKAVDKVVAGITDFKNLINEIQDRIDNVGLTDLEAKIQKFWDAWFEARGTDKQGAILDQIQVLEGLFEELTQKEYFTKLADEADALKESLKSPAEQLNDMRERLAEMLEQGFISTGDFDKGLAKARREIGGMGELQSGRFQEIRSEFIDVAALNAGNSATGVDKTNRLLEDNNRTLKDISRELSGSSSL